MTDPVFYAPAVAFEGQLVPLRDGAQPGRTVVLGGEEGRHAVKVQRLRTGESVDLVDGEGFRASGTVADGKGDAGLTVQVAKCQQEKPQGPALTLVQGLAKGGRGEQAIETATELGVDSVVPWQAERSIVRWDSSKKSGPQARWRRVLQAAMKQSRRAVHPTLEHPADSQSLTSMVAEATSRGDLVLICHESATHSIQEVLAQTDLASTQGVMVVVGPEGGITYAELDDLVQAGGSAVLLGPHVLRSSTAGPAALAVVNAATGRW